MSQLDDNTPVDCKAAWIAWDPYDVCKRLVRNNDICLEDSADSTSHRRAARAREFWTTVADYPESLQEALFVMAHVHGFEAAMAALDDAIQEHMGNGAGKDARTRKRVNGHSVSGGRE